MSYYDLTAHELHALMIKKQVSCREITESMLRRIEDTDGAIQSFLTVTADGALKTAEGVDKRLAAGEEIGALEGIPVALKDNLCTDGVRTTCASRMLENFVPFYDAHVVKRIKQQGCPILGKVNMDEFAMGSSTETSYFQTTRNPYDTTRVPGGSSGGSAAAVSAGQAVFALGSDTGGSIRQPASFCGVVGMKPTYGLVSRYGCVAFASSLDQIGPFAKDVTDCASVLGLLVGNDEMDSTSLNLPRQDYTAALTEDIRGMRIGVPSDYLGEGIGEEVKKAVLSALDVFRSLGATVEEYQMRASEYALPAYYIISGAEASSNLARFDGIRYGYRSGNCNSLKELYENSRSEGFGEEVKYRIMVGAYALSSGYYDAYYKKAQQVRTLISNDFKAQFERFDAVLTPTSISTAFEIGKKISSPIEMYLNDLCTVSVNLAGLPALSLPCGFDSKGLPIGLQLIGKTLDESTILRAAYAFEQSAGFHKKRPAVQSNTKGGAKA